MKQIFLVMLIVLMGIKEITMPGSKETEATKRTTTKAPAWLGRQERGVDGGLMGGGQATPQVKPTMADVRTVGQPTAAPVKQPGWWEKAMTAIGGGRPTVNTPVGWRPTEAPAFAPQNYFTNPQRTAGGDMRDLYGTAGANFGTGQAQQGTQIRRPMMTPAGWKPPEAPAFAPQNYFTDQQRAANGDRQDLYNAGWNGNASGAAGSGQQQPPTWSGAWDAADNQQAQQGGMSLRDYSWRYRRAVPPPAMTSTQSTGNGWGSWGSGWGKGGGGHGFGTNYDRNYNDYSQNQTAWTPDMGLFALNWKG